MPLQAALPNNHFPGHERNRASSGDHRLSFLALEHSLQEEQQAVADAISEPDNKQWEDGNNKQLSDT